MDSRFRNTVLFLISLCVIVLFLMLMLNDKKLKANVDTIKSTKNNYLVYEVDQAVKLIDDSEWYILKNSSSEEKEVYLISKNKINNDVIENVNYYISEMYLDELCRNLEISRDQITEIRLLNSNDIIELYEIGNESFNISFDPSKFKLLENDTIVDYIVDNKMYSLCREGFCNNDNNDIRIVIKIAKYFIKKED